MASTSVPSASDRPLRDSLLEGIADIDLLLFENDSGTEGSGDEDSSAPASNASTSTPSQPPERKRCLAHCHCVKAEREFLRRRIEELEQELAAMSTRTLAERSSSPLAWRSLALRQQSMRRRAELENERLKEKLRCQLQAATSLERVFRDKTRVLFDRPAARNGSEEDTTKQIWNGEANTERLLLQFEQDVRQAHAIAS